MAEPDYTKRHTTIGSNSGHLKYVYESFDGYGQELTIIKYDEKDSSLEKHYYLSKSHDNPMTYQKVIGCYHFASGRNSFDLVSANLVIADSKSIKVIDNRDGPAKVIAPKLLDRDIDASHALSLFFTTTRFDKDLALLNEQLKNPEPAKHNHYEIDKVIAEKMQTIHASGYSVIIGEKFQRGGYTLEDSRTGEETEVPEHTVQETIYKFIAQEDQDPHLEAKIVKTDFGQELSIYYRHNKAPASERHNPILTVSGEKYDLQSKTDEGTLKFLNDKRVVTFLETNNFPMDNVKLLKTDMREKIQAKKLEEYRDNKPNFWKSVGRLLGLKS